MTHKKFNNTQKMANKPQRRGGFSLKFHDVITTCNSL